MTCREKSKLSLRKQRVVGICDDERQSREGRQERGLAALGDAGSDKIRLRCLEISTGVSVCVCVCV